MVFLEGDGLDLVMETLEGSLPRLVYLFPLQESSVLFYFINKKIGCSHNLVNNTLIYNVQRVVTRAIGYMMVIGS